MILNNHAFFYQVKQWFQTSTVGACVLDILDQMVFPNLRELFNNHPVMKIFITIFTVCLIQYYAYGQQTASSKFTAKLQDGFNEPLAGVTIRVAGKNLGAVSDAQGNFTVDAGENDILQFSYIGFENAEFPVYEIEDGMLNNITLTSNALLREVVITADVANLKREFISNCCCTVECARHRSFYSDSLQVMSRTDSAAETQSWHFYPNPTTDGVAVETPESAGMITVFSLDGRLLKQTTVSSPLTRVNLRDLPAATYFLRYENEKGSTSVGKVVLAKH